MVRSDAPQSLSPDSMYIPLRYKVRTVAQVTAGLWYSIRGQSGARHRRVAALLNGRGLPHEFFGIDEERSAVILPEEERVRIISEAEDAAHGRIRVVGLGPVECGNPVDWHRDPITGRRFPAGVFDSGRDGAVDWRFCDEINLHRHLYVLGQAYYLTGDTRFAEAAIVQVASWLQANPPILDRYWHSPLQCAVRVVAWVWLLFLIRRALILEQQALLVDAIREHGRFIEKHSEAGTYNHLIGEWTALAMIGMTIPCLPEAQRWRNRGLDILAQETARQFGREGGHREQSIGYHLFVLDAYTHIALLGRQSGLEIDSRVTHMLERMYEFVMFLTRPDGTLPSMGDEGLRWHALSGAPLRDARRLLPMGAALFGRPDMKWLAGTSGSDSVWLLDGTQRQRFEEIPAQPPAFNSCSLSDAGIVVLRNGWGAADDYLMVDVGRQGVDQGGHSHADALNVDIVAAGAPLVLDAGTYTYSPQTGWRDYFRGTAAHNTVMVDGVDQAEPRPSQPFGWTHLANGRLRSWCDGTRLVFCDTEHDGYGRLAQPVSHRRLLFWPRDFYWLICDVITGAGLHRCENFWHFPATMAEWGGDEPGCTVGGDAQRLRIVPLLEDGVDAKLICGSTEPYQGWVSSEYGHKAPAPVLICERTGALPTLFATVLAPLRCATTPKVAIARLDVRRGASLLSSAEGGCIRVVLENDIVDYFLWSDAPGAVEAGPITSDGHVAFLRVSHGVPTSGVCLGGSVLLWFGQEVPTSELADIDIFKEGAG
jgi:hypothetical protein